MEAFLFLSLFCHLLCRFGLFSFLISPINCLQVGDFVFLSLRTRSSNLNVLNRERTPRYRLEIRAKVRRRGDGKRLRMKEPKCVVDVEVCEMKSSCHL